MHVGRRRCLWAKARRTIAEDASRPPVAARRILPKRQRPRQPAADRPATVLRQSEPCSRSAAARRPLLPESNRRHHTAASRSHARNRHENRHLDFQLWWRHQRWVPSAFQARVSHPIHSGVQVSPPVRTGTAPHALPFPPTVSVHRQMPPKPMPEAAAS